MCDTSLAHNLILLSTANRKILQVRILTKGHSGVGLMVSCALQSDLLLPGQALQIGDEH